MRTPSRMDGLMKNNLQMCSQNKDAVRNIRNNLLKKRYIVAWHQNKDAMKSSSIWGLKMQCNLLMASMHDSDQVSSRFEAQPCCGTTLCIS